MNDEHRLLLLKIIKFDGNVQPLIELGYDFAEVVNILKQEQKRGNAKIEKGVISLTSKGQQEIKVLDNKIGRKFPWIEPELESRIEKLSKDEVYVPLRSSIRELFK